MAPPARAPSGTSRPSGSSSSREDDPLRARLRRHAGAGRGRLRDVRHAQRRPLERRLRLPRADRRRARRRPPRRPAPPGLVGQPDRPRQAGRHRPLLRHLREPARRLPGHHRAGLDRPGDRRAVRPALPAVHGAPTSSTVHRALLAHLGIERLPAAIGGSLGGMQVLQWAIDHPDEIDAAPGDLRERAGSPRRTSRSRAVAREAIMRDPRLPRRRLLRHAASARRGPRRWRA